MIIGKIYNYICKRSVNSSEFGHFIVHVKVKIVLYIVSMYIQFLESINAA